MTAGVGAACTCTSEHKVSGVTCSLTGVQEECTPQHNTMLLTAPQFIGEVMATNMIPAKTVV
jgi:hypothetical protein